MKKIEPKVYSSRKEKLFTQKEREICHLIIKRVRMKELSSSYIPRQIFSNIIKLVEKL